MIDNIPSDFTLSLSGGGALGIAHLGVIADLEIAGKIPSEIIGVSMGSIIGACLAIGMREGEIFRHIETISKITNWAKLAKGGNTILDNTKIAKIFDSLFGETYMHQTKIPLKIIATNLKNGNKRVFDSNDETILIRDALLCSMAIPGMFPEHTIDNIVYVDGFLCENLGLLDATNGYILAVDALGKNSFKHGLPDNMSKFKNIMTMFGKSMRLLIHNQTKTNIALCKKNVHLIEPNTEKFETFHFNKAKEIRELGIGLLKHD